MLSSTVHKTVQEKITSETPSEISCDKVSLKEISSLLSRLVSALGDPELMVLHRGMDNFRMETTRDLHLCQRRRRTWQC